MADPLDPRAFVREDDEPDPLFYEFPRLLLHVDEETSRALAAWFGAKLPSGGDILDLMSAWASHLPEDAREQVRYRSMTGLGMNAEELRANPALTAGLLADINERPVLPFRDAAFDAVLISFSVQYLTRPVEVFAEIGRILKPGGMLHVAFSHRMFPTKAVAVWRATSDEDHARLVAHYVLAAGNLGEPVFDCPLQRDSGFDPLYIVSAAKA